jgi:integrase
VTSTSRFAKAATCCHPTRRSAGGGDEHLASLRLAPSTDASYRKLWRLYIKPHLGEVPLDKLTGTAITTMYRKLETGGRRDGKPGQGLKPRTIRYVHTTLNASLDEAVAQGLLAVNPARKAKPPAAREAKAPEIHPWNAAHVAIFLSLAEEQECPDAVAWRVLAFTGGRRGELLADRWRDLDMDARRLSIRRSVSVIKHKGKPAKLVEGPTKSGRERVVDLDAQTVEALRRYRVARAGLSLQLARDDALIFGDLEGHHQHPDHFSWRFIRQLARCRRQLGEDALPAIRLHDLRHTHASLLLAAGVPVKVVSERLGHATVSITLEIYAHTMPGMQSEAAARFAELVAGGA